MGVFQPAQRILSQLLGEDEQFCGVVLGGGSGQVVFHGVAFDSAGFEICTIRFSFVTQDERQSGQRPKMLQHFFGAITRRMEQDRAKLQCGVVGDAKLPVGGNLTLSIFKIAIDDGQQPGDFLSAGLMRSQPAVLRPIFQAHAHPRS